MLNAVTADVRSQVVDGDEEHIQRLRRKSGQQRAESGEEDELAHVRNGEL
jgi:hypothetical protein